MSSFLRSLIAALAFAALSCQPEIGDSCSNASDCSVQDQRTCDTTYPGGYCTVFGCSADSCPSEASCVGFQSVLSVAPECADPSARPRLQRTACMLTCGRDSDCRGGYACVELLESNPWGALVVDRSGGSRVCMLAAPAQPEGETGVCSRGPVGVVPVIDAGRSADAAVITDAAVNADAAVITDAAVNADAQADAAP